MAGDAHGRGRVRGMNGPNASEKIAWQGTGTWQQQANASEKTGSFSGRLLFFVAFVLFLRVLFGSKEIISYICQRNIWNRFKKVFIISFRIKLKYY